MVREKIFLQRDLILVPFPFSDQSNRKVRPVIVLSNNDFNKTSRDLLVVGVTSNPLYGNYVIELADTKMENGKLFTKCFVKSDNLLKIEKKLVLKKIGVVKKEIFRLITNKVNEILAES